MCLDVYWRVCFRRSLCAINENNFTLFSFVGEACTSEFKYGLRRFYWLVVPWGMRIFIFGLRGGSAIVPDDVSCEAPLFIPILATGLQSVGFEYSVFLTQLLTVPPLVLHSV